MSLLKGWGYAMNAENALPVRHPSAAVHHYLQNSGALKTGQK